MANKYDIVIGIEIHCQLKTNSKMFSLSKNSYNEKPNLHVSNIDLGYPGTKPLPNKKAIEFGIKLAKQLNMTIASSIQFDRKHYFYPDLAKGFQITQFYQPLGINGYLMVKDKKIIINEIHLEEDTAKQINNENETLLDFNRAGIPLIEIVTDHTSIKTPKEAMDYVATLRGLLLYLEISDAKMAEGSLRCDVNVSLKPKGSSMLGNKVEIKNINSISNIEIALNKEIKIQTKTLDSGKQVQQATKRYDDKLNDVIITRKKTLAIDYRYIKDPNLPPILISSKTLKQIGSKDLNYQEYKLALIERLNFTEEKIVQMLNQPINKVLKEIFNHKINLKKAYALLEITLLNYLNKTTKDLLELDFKTNDFIDLIVAREKGDISQQQAQTIFDKYMKGANIKNEINSLKAQVISDSSQLVEIIKELIKNNENVISEYSVRPERVIKFLMGQIMKATKGKVEPKKVLILIKQHLKER